MKKLHIQIFSLALILLFQTDSGTAGANPQSTKQSGQKLQGSSNQPAKQTLQGATSKPALTDEKFVEQAIKTHVPAAGQFSKRRQRIWEALRRNYAQKKDITQVLRQYLKMDDSVNRGTNWVTDDAGNYTRMPPLTARCRELEEKLDLPWQTVGK